MYRTKTFWKQLCAVLFCLLFAVIFWVEKGWSGTLTIKDMAERTVILPHKAERIVTTFKPATLCVVSLELQEKIIGIDTGSKRDRLIQAILPGVSTLAGVGTKSAGINFESVVSLSPDLVILYAQKDGFELAQRLARIKIPSIIILPESFASVEKSLEIIAKATGTVARAAKIKKAMDGILQMVAKKTQFLAAEQRKTAYFASPKGLFNTATGNMLQDEIFTLAGIINVAHNLRGYFQDISPEQFVVWNPDLVVVSQHLHQRIIKRLNDPVLRQTTAIAKKEVYRFPSDLAPWDFPSPLAVLGTLWLADKSYPELFHGVDIGKEIDLFHLKLFGKSLNDMHGTLNDQIY